ncbi:uncharacterized protein BJ171DRAFT_582192 [Polychytrium aggregatum]|uniref:uncharacterized protein n=1 Tax=Polychytrium aggregatum TaxID=110093 RepID=UPI0022FF1764|nr:uncharacterized protein BJ171DRAFT_582192 [Polychytrium aggregatum]KAI9204213.1 hypothetical protein BJ171DRAFT_582192 [Polychytrium aggregatum]
MTSVTHSAPASSPAVPPQLILHLRNQALKLEEEKFMMSATRREDLLRELFVRDAIVRNREMSPFTLNFSIDERLFNDFKMSLDSERATADARRSVPDDRQTASKSADSETKGYDFYAWQLKVAATQLTPLLQNAPVALTTNDWMFARDEAKQLKTLQRIEQLKSTNEWSFKQLKPQAPPPRAKVQWDHLLDEAKWLREDFRQERKWKIAAARQLSLWIMEWHGSSDRSALCIKARPPPAITETRLEESSVFDQFVSADAVGPSNMLSAVKSETEESSAYASRDYGASSEQPLYRPDDDKVVATTTSANRGTGILHADENGENSVVPSVLLDPESLIYPLGPEFSSEALDLYIESKAGSSKPKVVPMPLWGFSSSKDGQSDREYRPDGYYEDRIVPVSALFTQSLAVSAIDQYHKNEKSVAGSFASSAETAPPSLLLPQDIHTHESILESPLFGSPKRTDARDVPPPSSPAPASENSRRPLNWNAVEDEQLLLYAPIFQFNWLIMSDVLQNGPACMKEPRTPWDCYQRYKSLALASDHTSASSVTASSSKGALEPPGLGSSSGYSAIVKSMALMTSKKRAEARRRMKKHILIFEHIHELSAEKKRKELASKSTNVNIRKTVHETHTQAVMDHGCRPLSPKTLSEMKDKRDRELKMERHAAAAAAAAAQAHSLQNVRPPHHAIARPPPGVPATLPHSPYGYAVRPMIPAHMPPRSPAAQGPIPNAGVLVTSQPQSPQIPTAVTANSILSQQMLRTMAMRPHMSYSANPMQGAGMMMQYANLIPSMNPMVQAHLQQPISRPGETAMNAAAHFALQQAKQPVHPMLLRPQQNFSQHFISQHPQLQMQQLQQLQLQQQQQQQQALQEGIQSQASMSSVLGVPVPSSIPLPHPNPQARASPAPLLNPSGSSPRNSPRPAPAVLSGLIEGDPGVGMGSAGPSPLGQK